MKTRLAFEFRLVPTPEQEDLLSRHAGCVRFVWNKALDLQRRRLEAGIPLLSYGELCRLLTLWRASEEYRFLANGPAQPRQQALKNLDRALWEALDRTNPRRFPRFKKKGYGLNKGAPSGEIFFPLPEKSLKCLYVSEKRISFPFPLFFLPPFVPPTPLRKSGIRCSGRPVRLRRWGQIVFSCMKWLLPILSSQAIT